MNNSTSTTINKGIFGETLLDFFCPKCGFTKKRTIEPCYIKGYYIANLCNNCLKEMFLLIKK